MQIRDKSNVFVSRRYFVMHAKMGCRYWQIKCLIESGDILEDYFIRSVLVCYFLLSNMRAIKHMHRLQLLVPTVIGLSACTVNIAVVAMLPAYYHSGFICILYILLHARTRGSSPEVKNKVMLAWMAGPGSSEGRTYCTKSKLREEMAGCDLYACLAVSGRVRHLPINTVSTANTFPRYVQ